MHWGGSRCWPVEDSRAAGRDEISRAVARENRQLPLPFKTPSREIGDTLAVGQSD